MDLNFQNWVTSQVNYTKIISEVKYRDIGGTIFATLNDFCHFLNFFYV